MAANKEVLFRFKPLQLSSVGGLRTEGCTANATLVLEYYHSRHVFTLADLRETST